MINNTTIIGAGPAGLLQALYMLQRGHNVTILERRTEYKLRENSVFLQDSLVKMLLRDFTQFYQCGFSIEYEFCACELKVLVKHDPGIHRKYIKMADLQNINAPQLDQADYNFIKIIKIHLGNIAINDFQNYLENKANILAQTRRLAFNIMCDAIVYDIDKDSEQVLYKNSNNQSHILHFDNLIVCSGASFELAEKILGQNALQDVRSADFTNCAHAVGFVNYNGEDKKLLEILALQKPIVSPFIPLALRTRSKNLIDYQELGWHHAAVPKFYIIVQPEYQRFYFACEIPADWHEEKGKAKLDDSKLNNDMQQKLHDKISTWIKQALKLEYAIHNLNDLRLECDPCKATNLQTFMKPTKKLKSAYVKTANANIFFVGDLLFNSVYKLGTGHYFAGLSAKAVAECFDDKTSQFKDSTPMNKLLLSLQREYDRILKLYFITNYMCHNQIQTRYIYEPICQLNSNLYWLYEKIAHPQVKNVSCIDRQEVQETKSRFVYKFI